MVPAFDYVGRQSYIHARIETEGRFLSTAIDFEKLLFRELYTLISVRLRNRWWNCFE